MGILGLATSLLKTGAEDIAKGAEELGGAAKSAENSMMDNAMSEALTGKPASSNSGSSTNEGGLAQALQGLGIERAPQNEQNTEHVPGAVGGTEEGL
jgi:hypothetical protein